MVSVKRSTIRYAEDEFRVSGWLDWLNVLDSRLAAQGMPPALRPTGEAPDAAPAVAVLNHARWLAHCECGSAVMLFRGAEWMWCPSCGNAAAGGKMRPVQWPADLERINRDAESQPTGLAHWTPEDEARRELLRRRAGLLRKADH